MREKPKILVVGLGETGCELAEKLTQNWQVVGLDLKESAIEEMRRTEGAHPDLTLHKGDATSGYVLRQMKLDGLHAVVACTGSDEVNLEVQRLARDQFKIQNRFALMYSLDWEDRYHEEGVEVVSQDHACAAILESRIEGGQKVATSIGMGLGEIMEVEVLPRKKGRKGSVVRPDVGLNLMHRAHCSVMVMPY